MSPGCSCGVKAKDRDATVRYLLQNMDWLDDELGEYEDDYLIIDCPGEMLFSSGHGA